MTMQRGSRLLLFLPLFLSTFSFFFTRPTSAQDLIWNYCYSPNCSARIDANNYGDDGVFVYGCFADSSYNYLKTSKSGCVVSPGNSIDDGSYADAPAGLVYVCDVNADPSLILSNATCVVGNQAYHPRDDWDANDINYNCKWSHALQQWTATPVGCSKNGVFFRDHQVKSIYSNTSGYYYCSLAAETLYPVSPNQCTFNGNSIALGSTSDLNNVRYKCWVNATGHAMMIAQGCVLNSQTVGVNQAQEINGELYYCGTYANGSLYLKDVGSTYTCDYQGEKIRVGKTVAIEHQYYQCQYQPATGLALLAVGTVSSCFYPFIDSSFGLTLYDGTSETSIDRDGANHTVTFILTRSGILNQNLTVDLCLNGTAIEGEDFEMDRVEEGLLWNATSHTLTVLVNVTEARFAFNVFGSLDLSRDLVQIDLCRGGYQAGVTTYSPGEVKVHIGSTSGGAATLLEDHPVLLLINLVASYL